MNASLRLEKRGHAVNRVSDMRCVAPVWRCVASMVLAIVLTATAAAVEETDVTSNHSATRAATDIADAIRRSIKLVERSSAKYLRKRECFSCHHQATAVLMLSEARRHGFVVDEENLRAQLDHTAEHLRRGLENYRNGQGQGGRVDTAAWALWTLDEGSRGSEETTAAVAGYLLTADAHNAHWGSAGQRPPTQGSPLATTYVAVRGLVAFGASVQQVAIDRRIANAYEWPKTAEAGDTEDRVYRLRAMAYLSAKGKADVDAELIEAAARDVLLLQRLDGGWGQTPDLPTDAYATGTALVALHEAQKLVGGERAYRAGIEFLLRTQLDDGSWRVKTRAKPIQTYFESGFPHEKDQFVSMAAMNWATTLALLFTAEKSAREESHREISRFKATCCRVLSELNRRSCQSRTSCHSAA